MPGCSTAPCDRVADRRAPRRRHRAICCATRIYQHTVIDRGHRARAAVAGAGTTFSSTPVDVIAARFGLEGPRVVRRRGLLVEHDRDRPGGRRDPRPAALDAALAGGTDALARLTFSGFNALRLMDPAPCRPFDREPRRHEHRRGRRHPRARGHGPRAARAARTSTPSSPATASRARRFIRPRRSRTAGRSRAVMRDGARATPASTPTTSITSTRTAPPRRRTIAPRRAASSACSATAIRAGSGDLAQVDDRPLPRRRRRARGGGPGADRRARRDPADDPSRARPIPSARSTSSPTRRASSACGAACRRRSDSAATTRRW